MSVCPPAVVAIVLIVLLSTEHCCDAAQVTSSSNESSMPSNAVPSTPEMDIPGSWVSDLFYQALANFTLRHAGSSECRKQAEIYDNHLRNYTSWAVRSEYFMVYYTTIIGTWCIKYIMLYYINHHVVYGRSKQ